MGTKERCLAGVALALPKQVYSGEFKRSQINPWSKKSWAACMIWGRRLLLSTYLI